MAVTNLVLIVGQIHPALHALATAGFHGGMGLFQFGKHGIELGAGNRVFARKFAEHGIDVQFDAHIHIKFLQSFLRSIIPFLCKGMMKPVVDITFESANCFCHNECTTKESGENLWAEGGFGKRGFCRRGPLHCCACSAQAFAGKAAKWISIPAAGLLAGISGKFPVPVFGILALLALAGLIFGKGRRGGIAFCIAAAYVLLWLPPTNAPTATYPRAGQARTEALCRALAEELVQTGRQAVSLSEGLIQAQAAMNAPARPKAARFPAWLRGLKAAGMYVPFTGEALVDPTRSAAGPALYRGP